MSESGLIVEPRLFADRSAAKRTARRLASARSMPANTPTLGGVLRSIRIGVFDDQQSPEVAFQAAVGVVQNSKNLEILAVHNEGRKLVVHDKAKMSNAKFYVVLVEPNEEGCQVKVAVGTDPRTSEAILDGKFNQRSLTKYLSAVQAALDGSAPAPATAVPNHYMQKKTQVPWDNPNAEPDIELGGNLVAFFFK